MALEKVPHAAQHLVNTRCGLTLVEVIVVLILLGLAAGLVAPAIIFREAGEQSQLAQVIAGSHALAVRRGEIIHLHVAGSGEWRVEGAVSIAEGVLARGRIDDFQGPAFTLVVSPIGTCGFDVLSTEAARVFPVDPLTCAPQTAAHR